MSAVSRVCSVNRPRCASKRSPNAFCASAFLDRTRRLVTSEMSEVTSRRVLSKNADAQKALGDLFDAHRGRFTEHTRLTADIKLPELTRDSFIDLYPRLPYQIDLIIHLVSCLPTQPGPSNHVCGAHRPIIKLAQP